MWVVHTVTVHHLIFGNYIAATLLHIFCRNQIRGGTWSALGKNIEYPLLKSMCMLFEVSESNYSRGNRSGLREVDFCFIDGNGELKRCEVKLMGKGNPEGADSLYARDANVFIASKLSDTNIEQLNNEGVEWVELNKPFGFLRFGEILERYSIPHNKLTKSEFLEMKIRHVTYKLAVNDFEKVQ